MKKQILMTLMVGILMPLGAMASGPIWPGQKDWNQGWEMEFAMWLDEKAQDPEFFSRLGIRVDCADVVYGLRWIFAREYDLKMAVHSHEGILSNESVHELWDHLPTHHNWEKDEKFMASLDWMMRRTYTKSLVQESYPIELSEQAFQAGTFYLNIETGHHAQMIVSTNYSDENQMPLRFLVGTVPRSRNPLKIVDYWASHQNLDGRSGFRKFRWPKKENGQWIFVRPEQMPYYSTEQYDPKLLKRQRLTYSGYIYKKIKPRLNLLSKIELGLEELTKYIRARIQIVEEGYAFCKERPSCLDKSGQDYDNWSTPSRDKRVWNLFEEVITDVEQSRNRKARRLWESITENTVVFHFERQPISLAEIYEIWSDRKYSSEPWDPPIRRWGLHE